MSVYIFNDSGASKNWRGQAVNDQAYYLIPETERPDWAVDDPVLTDIGNSDAIISSTNSSGGHFASVSEGITYLQAGTLDVEPVIQVEKFVMDGKGFTTTTDLNSVALSEVALLYFKNPSASGKDALVTHFKFGTDSANTRTLIRIYSNPTVTADGTSITIANTLIDSGAAVSVMECYKLPTVTANGGQLNLDISPANSQSKGLNRFYLVKPGNSILLTVDNSQSNAETFSDIYWIEGI